MLSQKNSSMFVLPIGNRIKMKLLRHLILVLLFNWSMMAFGQQDSMPDLRQQLNQATELMNAFQFDKAQELLSECYIREPNNILYLNKIAYCNLQLGRYRDAKIFYKETLKLDSINTTALSSLGNIYERENNYKEAQQYYQQLIEIDSTNSYYFKRNGFMALRLNKVLGAIGFFLKAHELNESDIEVIDQLCSIYLALEELDYADQMLRKGLNLDPNNLKLIYNKARLHQKKKEHATVVETIERAMVQGDTSNYYQMMLGVAYLHIDSLDQAVFHLEEIIKREKDSEHTHHYLALAYRQKGEEDKSVVHLEKAIEKAISPKITVYHGDMASISEEQGHYKTAIKHFEAAHRYSGEDIYLFHLARNHDLYYKDKKMALRLYKKYLNSKDDKYRAYTEERITQLKEIIHFQN